METKISLKLSVSEVKHWGSRRLEVRLDWRSTTPRHKNLLQQHSCGCFICFAVDARWCWSWWFCWKLCNTQDLPVVEYKSKATGYLPMSSSARNSSKLALSDQHCSAQRLPRSQLEWRGPSCLQPILLWPTQQISAAFQRPQKGHCFVQLLSTSSGGQRLKLRFFWCPVCLLLCALSVTPWPHSDIRSVCWPVGWLAKVAQSWPKVAQIPNLPRNRGFLSALQTWNLNLPALPH